MPTLRTLFFKHLTWMKFSPFEKTPDTSWFQISLRIPKAFPFMKGTLLLYCFSVFLSSLTGIFGRIINQRQDSSRTVRNEKFVFWAGEFSWGKALGLIPRKEDRKGAKSIYFSIVLSLTSLMKLSFTLYIVNATNFLLTNTSLSDAHFNPLGICECVSEQQRIFKGN